jgi:hypothetical protein
MKRNRRKHANSEKWKASEIQSVESGGTKTEVRTGTEETKEKKGRNKRENIIVYFP